MGKTRRVYTAEFKREAVRLVESSGKPVTEVARELGIGYSCLLRWRQQLGEDGENAFPGHGRMTPEQERIRELERENLVLRQERDILKDAIRIFSHPKA
jgi:transposase